MWGYIDSFFEQVGRGYVPSLYVRVYRGGIIRLSLPDCSLIICEGISLIFSPDSFFFGFPHYMWGYIDLSREIPELTTVPSLYVRVYRNTFKRRQRCCRSLIICEGISDIGRMWEICWTFPHYMWGYIGLSLLQLQTNKVPSLYVRVYRERDETPEPPRSSLIICEGISLFLNYTTFLTQFPHYMWGYIAWRS